MVFSKLKIQSVQSKAQNVCIDVFFHPFCLKMTALESADEMEAIVAITFLLSLVIKRYEVVLLNVLNDAHKG